MRLRHRPWALLAYSVFATVGILAFGFDLADGEVTTRHIGHADLASTPARFGVVVVMYVLACVVTLFSWVIVRSEWKIDYLPPLKPPIDNPDFRQPL